MADYSTLSTTKFYRSSDAPRIALQPDTVLDRKFKLVCLLGAGGMGAVFLAENLLTKAKVAIKVLRTDGDAAAEEDLQRHRMRFRQEAQIMAQLRHPNIVPVRDMGMDDVLGVMYYVMDLFLVTNEQALHVCDTVWDAPRVSGADACRDETRALTLSDFLQDKKTLPELTVAKMALQLTDAVRYAHAHNPSVIHRDIKPSNILIDECGAPLLTDFGIAKVCGARHGKTLHISTCPRTMENAAVGTEHYVSPEQRCGEPATAASDYYGLGVVLYKALTGEYPSCLKKPSEVHGKHIAKAWDTLLTGMLESDPAKRLSDPDEIMAALTGIIASKTKRKRRLVRCLPVVVLAVPAGIVLYGIVAHNTGTGTDANAPVPAHAEPAPGEKKDPFANVDMADELLKVDALMTPEEAEYAARVFAEAIAVNGVLDAGESRIVELPGNVALEMVKMTAGAFKSASGRVGTGYVDLALTDDFLLGKYELTQEQYTALMGVAASGFIGENLPAGNVSWYEAMAFCKKLTVREHKAGRLPAGYVYSLPTEAQWEYACRAGTLTAFAFGDDLDHAQANFGRHPKDSDYVKPKDQPEKVGTFKPNAWGLHDMHGNVSEWCFDKYVPRNAPGPFTNRVSFVGRGHVVRDGNWVSQKASCGSSFRRGNIDRYVRNGFRVALVPARMLTRTATGETR